MRTRVKKSNKGITLIALVITIIVLLILAGVTIATLIGDNGILTKANEAKEKNEIAEVKERAQLDIVSWVTDKMENGEDATVDTPTLVKSILDEANPDESNRYYKDVTDEGVVTPNDYVVPIEELYTNGTGYIQAGTEVEERPSDWESTQVTAIADGEGDVIPLPDNFYYVGGTKSEGIVISDNSADKGRGTSHEVAQTLQGNQFVWVPVEEDADFQRYEGYRRTNLDNLKNDAKEPFVNEEKDYELMKNSVLQYNGFYIGRYEAGTDSDLERTENSGILDKVVIMQGKHVYNNIGWSNSDDMTVKTGGAMQKAKEFANENGYTSVESTLIYGIEWDAIMQFIDSSYKNEDGKLTSFVANSTGKGNYSQNLNVTGSNVNYSVKNIYDLAGNVNEWTMETCYNDYRIFRGGDYKQKGDVMPASVRNYDKPSRVDDYGGFRVSLYL